MMTTVLLADGQSILRKGLRTLLESMGRYQVVGETGDGREAVELTRDLKPDLVILDVALPALNGVNATEQIAQDSPATRVIALTARSASGHVSSMLRAGARGYVLKDADPDELFKALSAVQRGQTYLSSHAATSLVEDYVSGGNGGARPALSPREREVLQLMAEGLSTKQIAKTLYVSVKTVETHRRHIMQKLEIHSVAGLTKYAIREGLTTVETKLPSTRN
jgi:DNA-binding NarL/FixJ family response regulator